jgi:hypothetical protein
MGTMKGKVQADHMPVNKYSLFIVGMPPIMFTKVSGIEEELQTVDLPDRTSASGGHTAPVEFTAESMMHHSVERYALELWYKEGQDPVSPLYKKVGTLIHHSLTGDKLATYTLIGCFVKKRKLPDLEMANEGEPAVIEWTFKADQVTPVPGL